MYEKKNRSGYFRFNESVRVSVCMCAPHLRPILKLNQLLYNERARAIL